MVDVDKKHFHWKSLKYDGDPSSRPVEGPSFTSIVPRFLLRIEVYNNVEDKVPIAVERCHKYGLNVIGTSPMDSTYRLQHPTVDAVHAIIAIHESDNDNTCILYDFKSFRGTYVGTIRFKTFVARKIKPFYPIVLKEKTAIKFGGDPKIYLIKGVHNPISNVKTDRNTTNDAIRQFRIGPTLGRANEETWTARHMNSWHLRSKITSKLTLNQYDKVFRAYKHPRQEDFIKGIEVLSCFTFDCSKILQVISNLNADRGTKTAAKRDLYEMVNVAFRAGKSIKDDKQEKGKSRPTIGALRRFKIFYKCKNMQHVRDLLQKLADGIVATEWKPKDVDQKGIGKRTAWNCLDGMYMDDNKKENINGNNNNTTTVSTAIILKESLKIPKSYLIQSVDKDILRPEYFQHVQQPEYPMSLTLTRTDLNEKWENTTVKTISSNGKIIDAIDLSGSSLSGKIPCQKIFKLLQTTQSNNLRVLSLSNCKLMPKSVTILSNVLLNKTNKQLLVLRIGNNRIVQGEKIDPGDPNSTYHYDSSGITALFSALGKNKFLRVLDIKRNNIGPRGVKLFTTWMKGNKSLTELDVSSNGIGNKGALMLDGMTRGPNSTLAHLFIGRNQIEHHGFHVLFQPPAPIPASRDLYERRSLRCLSTRANKGLTGEMVAILVTNLKYGWNDLVAIDFSWCTIGSRGATQLTFLLRQCKCLKSLNVGHCNLTDQMTFFEPMIKLVDSLKRNQTLTDLDLSYNSLVHRKLGYKNDGEDVIKHLIISLEENASLITLNLKGNAIGNAIRLRLQKLCLKTNRLPLPNRIAFWMVTQPRLGYNSPAKILHRGLILYILSFCDSYRVISV